MDVGIVNSFFLSGWLREAGSILIEGGGMIFQKAGGRICWYFYKLADLFN